MYTHKSDILKPAFRTGSISRELIGVSLFKFNCGKIRIVIPMKLIKKAARARPQRRATWAVPLRVRGKRCFWQILTHRRISP